jgi:hypothetical protein
MRIRKPMNYSEEICAAGKNENAAVNDDDDDGDASQSTNDSWQHRSIASLDQISFDVEDYPQSFPPPSASYVDPPSVAVAGLLSQKSPHQYDQTMTNAVFSHPKTEPLLPDDCISTTDLRDHDVIFVPSDHAHTVDIDAQSHKGTQMYHAEVQAQERNFSTVVSDKEKRAIRRGIIQNVQARGGRFWRFESAKVVPNLWKEVRGKALNSKVEGDLSYTQRDYIEGDIRDVDYLVGRGGHNTRHPGNQTYLDQKDRLQECYTNAKTRSDKHQISKDLVHWVHARGGRFLKRDSVTRKWYIVPNDIAYKQARQKLTEPRKKAAATTATEERHKSGHSSVGDSAGMKDSE